MNGMFMVPVAYADGSESMVYKCECSWTSTDPALARDHQARGCEDPKAWDPKEPIETPPTREQKAAAKKARKEQEALLFREELAAALSAARREGLEAGLAEGAYQGLRAAQDAVAKVRNQAEAWGNAEAATASVIHDEIEGLAMSAGERRPE